MSSAQTPVLPTLDECRQNAPVALPPIHLPRWLVNQASLWLGQDGKYSTEDISARVAYFVALGVAAHEAATPSPLPNVAHDSNAPLADPSDF